MTEGPWSGDSSSGIGELAAAVREGRIAARDVIDEHLTRVAALNPALNAIVIHDAERARAAADNVPLGPLAGVPFTVKEAIAIAGLPGQEASLLRPRDVAVADAGVV